MANLCLAALEELRGFLLAPDGLEERIFSLSKRDGARPPMFMPRQVVVQHVPRELSDAISDNPYPAVYLFCRRLENRLERKFTTFSGRLTLIADIRVSGDEAETLDGEVGRFVEAILDILAEHRGQWTDELCFDGRVEARFDPLELGGRQFVQTAAIEIELLAHA